MLNHPAQFVTFAEALAYIGFSDDEIDTHVDKYDSLLSAYRNREFRSICLRNRYSLTLDHNTLSSNTENGKYTDIIEMDDGLYSIVLVDEFDLVF